MVTSFYYIKEPVRNRNKPLAHPHFSICKKLKAHEAWSGLLERLDQVSGGASNPMEAKTGSRQG